MSDISALLAARARRFAALGLPGELGFIDCETGGLDEDKEEIVEIAAIRIDPITYEVKAEMHELVFPTKPVPHAAAVLNGYNEKQWAEKAVPLAVALERLNPVIAGSTMAGQNPDFDHRFLKAASKLTGIELAKLGNYRKLDVSSMAWPLYTNGLIPSASLDTTTAFLQVPGERHRAKSDVMRAIGVYKILLDVFGPAAEEAFADMEVHWCPQCRRVPVSKLRDAGRIFCSKECTSRFQEGAAKQ